MKLWKILTIITGSLCAFSYFLNIGIIYLSSKMQGHYKSLMGEPNGDEMLRKKQLWVQIGESPVLGYIFLVCLALFIVALFIYLIKKKKSKIV